MLKRAFQIGLAVYLVMGVSGLAPVFSEAIAGVQDDCCSDCEDPDCPDHDGQECPPQCDDCVCPCWVAPLVIAASPVGLDSPPSQDMRYVIREVTLEQPVSSGVFRPPRDRA